MFAVIEAGGKQYRVAQGDKLKIEKIEAEDKADFVFDKVLLIDTDKDVKVGTPYVKGAKVEAKILRDGKAKTVIVFKYKPKKRYRVKKGHRQKFTEVEIVKISG
ncbi:MAG: 50S ribosomal protein L21 [Candidatus Colwellbacteria bacterium]|nr:50S ribosomal protein L21 [Candidatus Colwellbacteria bacterium]